eukprot:107790-Lingulodinium_polyedra.AAC.1
MAWLLVQVELEGASEALFGPNSGQLLLARVSWLVMLSQDGYEVIPSVAAAGPVESFLNAFWDLGLAYLRRLQRHLGWRRARRHTWCTHWSA